MMLGEALRAGIAGQAGTQYLGQRQRGRGA
jgi:hypothetical protein